MAQAITRREFMAQTVGLAGLTAVLPRRGFASMTHKGRPNIVLIMADDLGYGDVGCYGCADIRTPTIDKLAAEGVRFTTFYANGPECSPTRTALLTGRYQQRVGGLECAIGIGNVGRYDDAIRLRETNDLGLPADQISIARILKDAGYATAIFGKWHLGYESKFSPNNHGFDHAFYAIGGGMDYFHHVEPPPSNMHALYQNGKPIKRKGYFTDLVTDEAIQFIEQQTKDSPFFLYIPFTAPHSPYQGPSDYRPQPLPEDSELWNQSKGPKDIYFAMIERMDQCIGKILRKLEEKKLADNTVVIFMSDNGASRSGSNLPFSGYKGNLFEGGIRVPCIAKWPGVLPEGFVSAQPCMTMDFSASIVRAAGQPAPRNRPFDGIDILELIEKNQPVRKRTLFWRARRGQWTRKAVRHGALKYISLAKGDDVQEYLFDLEQDPMEKNNLISSRTKVTRTLKLLLKDWEEKVKHKR
ncbi:MAG: sulfatase-like hydrolase/transferase [Sedimentisphaerales bacterium]